MFVLTWMGRAIVKEQNGSFFFSILSQFLICFGNKAVKKPFLENITVNPSICLISVDNLQHLLVEITKTTQIFRLPINIKVNFIVPLAFAKVFIVSLSFAFFVPFGRLCTDVKVCSANILKFNPVSSQLKI